MSALLCAGSALLSATALPLLRGEWAASATELGVVVAAYQVGYVGAVLVLLPLTDRVPVGRVMTVAAAVPREQRGLAIGVYVSAFYLGSAASLWATGALLAFTTGAASPSCFTFPALPRREATNFVETNPQPVGP